MSGVVFAVIMAIIISYFTFVESWSDFDKDKWDKYTELRIYMAEGMIQDNKIIGMSKDEVVALLGESTIKTTENCYEYYVYDGTLDPYFLRITFENDKVNETVIWEH